MWRRKRLFVGWRTFVAVRDGHQVIEDFISGHVIETMETEIFHESHSVQCQKRPQHLARLGRVGRHTLCIATKFLTHDLMAFRAFAHTRTDQKRHGDIFVSGRGTELIDQCTQTGIGLALMPGERLFEFVAMQFKLIAREGGQKPGLAFAIIDDAGFADAGLFGNGVDTESADAMTTRNAFDGLHQALTINAALASHSPFLFQYDRS